jgi:hypothetical protein
VSLIHGVPYFNSVLIEISVVAPSTAIVAFLLLLLLLFVALSPTAVSLFKNGIVCLDSVFCCDGECCSGIELHYLLDAAIKMSLIAGMSG